MEKTLTPYQTCELIISKNGFLFTELLEHLNMKQLEELRKLLCSTCVNNISKKIIDAQIKIKSNYKFAYFYEKYPILYRGSHLSELDPKLPLSKIQGRPNDKSYSGYILHLSNSFLLAKGYSLSNASLAFKDSRTSVMLYDTKILYENGVFETLFAEEIIPDPMNTKSFIRTGIYKYFYETIDESLMVAKEVRWKNEEPDGQEKRLLALIGVYTDKFIPKHELIFDTLEIPETPNCEVVEKYYFITYYSSEEDINYKLYLVLENNRIWHIKDEDFKSEIIRSFICKANDFLLLADRPFLVKTKYDLTINEIKGVSFDIKNAMRDNKYYSMQPIIGSRLIYFFSNLGDNVIDFVEYHINLV